MFVHGHIVVGEQVDPETRCTHYRSEKDRIAIKFYCCGKYFPCYKCHEQYGCGKQAVWPREKFHERAILCGSCGMEMSIATYLLCKSSCPTCQSSFNPGCSLHAHLYFAMESSY